LTNTAVGLSNATSRFVKRLMVFVNSGPTRRVSTPHGRISHRTITQGHIASCWRHHSHNVTIRIRMTDHAVVATLFSGIDHATARAGIRRVGLLITLRAVRALTKAPHRTDSLWQTLRAVNRGGRARTVDQEGVGPAARLDHLHWAIRITTGEQNNHFRSRGGPPRLSPLCRCELITKIAQGWPKLRDMAYHFD
jgi:hypothetical protein